MRPNNIAVGIVLDTNDLSAIVPVLEHHRNKFYPNKVNEPLVFPSGKLVTPNQYGVIEIDEFDTNKCAELATRSLARAKDEYKRLDTRLSLAMEAKPFDNAVCSKIESELPSIANRVSNLSAYILNTQACLGFSRLDKTLQFSGE